MGRGLDSFDRFAWKSLLSGREALVCRPDRAAALRTANALEQAGARATVAESERQAADWLLRRIFTLILIELPDRGPFGRDLVARAKDLDLVVLAPQVDHDRLLHSHPAAILATSDISERDLVMKIVRSRDE